MLSNSSLPDIEVKNGWESHDLWELSRGPATNRDYMKEFVNMSLGMKDEDINDFELEEYLDEL